MATVAAIGGVLVLGLGSAQAAKASPDSHVMCSAGALVTAIGGGGTLHLAHNCTYQMTATLTVSTDTTIYGDGATIEGGAPDCDFSIMTVDSAVHLTLNGVNFTKGKTLDDGGAIDDNGDLTVNGGTFSHNSAEYGGAIDVEAGSLTINDAVFTDNYGVHGGAVHLDGDGITYITNTDLSQNRAVQGGAIFSFSGVHVADSSIAENAATAGGAIYDYGPAPVTVYGSVISFNLARDVGGGVYYCGGSISLPSSVVYGNVPDDTYNGGSCGV